MPKIKIIKPFRFAHDGHRVEAFEVGPDAVETTDECAALALAEGWGKRVVTGPRTAPERAATGTAPQTKTSAGEPGTAETKTSAGELGAADADKPAQA